MEKEKKPNGYWTKERVFEEARKYRTKKEFERKCHQPYKVTIKNGWFSEMDWFEEKCKPAGYWTKEHVFEEARKYNTKVDFLKGCASAYSVARKNNWFNEMVWFTMNRRPNGYWTKENIFKESRKCKTKREFQKKCSRGYEIARNEGWDKEIYWLEEIHKPHGYWTKERVFDEARKYKTKKEFRNNSSGAYTVAYINRWFDKMTWLESDQNPVFDPIYSVYCYRFNDYNTIYIGLTMSINQRKWSHANQKESPVYSFAKKNGIEVPEMEILIDGLYQKEAQLYEGKLRKVSEYVGMNTLNSGATGVGTGSLGGAVKKWTKPKVFEAARSCNTRNEFKRKFSGAYQQACKKGWYKEMDWFEEVRKPKGYWTNQLVTEESIKYKTKNEFRKRCKGAYKAARRLGILDQLFPKKQTA